VYDVVDAIYHVKKILELAADRLHFVSPFEP
jgi:hypothetical protein